MKCYVSKTQFKIILKLKYTVNYIQCLLIINFLNIYVSGKTFVGARAPQSTADKNCGGGARVPFTDLLLV